MFVELHILQNFAPSNLNRDDTGSPKDCEFGGYRRARISSQCLKRAMRTSLVDRQLVSAKHLSTRTKGLADELVKRLGRKDTDAEPEARAVVETALKGLGLALVEDYKTQYLLLLSEAEIQRLVDLCTNNWSALVDASQVETSVEGNDSKAKGKADKKAAKGALPAELRKAIDGVIYEGKKGGEAIDLALFGRMLADRPEKNFDAASQVAHAISTNQVSMEFDFYTAVDDLKPDDTAGAGMMGTVEFNSACFYRYANVDLAQLAKNLGANRELAVAGLKAFLKTAIDAVPTGKQNSMAAHNPPSFVMAVVRESRLWSLANAFLRPVRPDASGDLMEKSIRALDDHWSRLAGMYGKSDIAGVWQASMHSDAINNLRAHEAKEGVAEIEQRVSITAENWLQSWQRVS